MNKVDYARTIARHTPTSTARRPKPETADRIESRAADIAKRYTLPYLRAWAASYVAGSPGERQTAAEAMRAEDPSSLIEPAPLGQLRREVIEIHRRARERRATDGE